MTPEQIIASALQIAGDRALSTSRSQMNLMITCADANIASALRTELDAAKINATPHRNNANIIIVMLRPRQQFVMPRREPNFHIGRFYGERGER